MPTSMVRATSSLSAAALVILSFLCGCEDIDWDWEMQEWRKVDRPIRPTRQRAPEGFRPHQPLVRTGSDPTKPAPKAQEQAQRDKPQPAANQQPVVRQGAPAQPSQGQRAYYQLYLISLPASLKAPPNSKKVRLAEAASRPAVDVLNRIYPSIGPSGAEGQRFLLYQYQPMWSAASDFIPLVDCAPVAAPPAADPTDPMAAFQLALGLYYHLKQPGQATDFEGYRRCLRLLQSAYQSSQASGQLRWGAAVFAGQVAVEALSEFDQARRHFESAKGSALPGSVEEMIAAYLLADLRIHEGQKEAAAKLAQDLCKQFVAHRASHVYERAVAMAQSQ
ncbi:MAG: hypothetical protein JXQ73_02250 [Phycisphaerae bacterium]|nr:hypothetical protein [Phycisphaerae bacterium]